MSNNADVGMEKSQWNRWGQRGKSRHFENHPLTKGVKKSFTPCLMPAKKEPLSATKSIKVDWKCRLKTETLDQVMRITLTGPDLIEFDAKRLN